MQRKKSEILNRNTLALQSCLAVLFRPYIACAVLFYPADLEDKTETSLQGLHKLEQDAVFVGPLILFSERSNSHGGKGHPASHPPPVVREECENCCEGASEIF